MKSEILIMAAFDWSLSVFLVTVAYFARICQGGCFHNDSTVIRVCQAGVKTGNTLHIEAETTVQSNELCSCTFQQTIGGHVEIYTILGSVASPCGVAINFFSSDSSPLHKVECTVDYNFNRYIPAYSLVTFNITGQGYINTCLSIRSSLQGSLITVICRPKIEVAPAVSTTTSRASAITTTTTTQTALSGSPQTTTIPPTTTLESETTNQTPLNPGTIEQVYRFPVTEVVVGISVGVVLIFLLIVVVLCYRRVHVENTSKEEIVEEQKQVTHFHKDSSEEMREIETVSLHNPAYFLGDDLTTFPTSTPKEAQFSLQAGRVTSPSNAAYTAANKTRTQTEIAL